MSWTLDGRPIGSVLVTRLRYLGDIVMSTVLIRALRAGDPGLGIGYLCEDIYADVLAGQPDLDRVHRLGVGRRGPDARARAASPKAAGAARSTPGTVTDLRRARYDLAVDLFFNPRSAWLLKLAGIPRRIGGTTSLRGRLFTHRVLRSDLEDDGFTKIAPGGLGEHLCRLAPLTHAETGLPFVSWLADRFSPGDLCPRLGAFPLTAGARKVLDVQGIDPDEPFLLLAPGATWASKEWPTDRWEEMVSLLVENQALPLAVMTAPGKESVTARMGEGIPGGRGGVLAPLSLGDALAVTSAARALVTVDGGLMHAAVGLQVPTLALFGPTDPGIWFPYRNAGPYRVLARAPRCHPCDLHECPAFICLPELEPGMVWDALASLLEDTVGAGGGRA